PLSIHESPGREYRDAVHSRDAGRAGAPDAHLARRGQVLCRSRHAPPVEGQRSDRLSLLHGGRPARQGGQSERLARAHRRRDERGRDRAWIDAASRASRGVRAGQHRWGDDLSLAPRQPGGGWVFIETLTRPGLDASEGDGVGEGPEPVMTLRAPALPTQPNPWGEVRKGGSAPLRENDIG